jgi:uncharacterized protein (TIGR03435 family)
MDWTRLTHRMSRTKKWFLAIAGVSALASSMLVYVPRILAQQTATPKFEVASIRPCGRGDSGGGGDTKGGGGNVSPGRLTRTCQSLAGLINAAYVLFAGDRLDRWSRMPISGGPNWINSERYDINAKADGNPSQEMMQGPMLRALLEDRFKLKIHRETREVPVYALIVNKGGLKLHRFEEGSCTPIDFTRLDLSALLLAQEQKRCRGVARKIGRNRSVDAQGMSLDEFSKIFLNGSLDRPVINKTGITGKFDFRLEYAPDDPSGGPPAAPSNDPVGPSIFTAVQEQLGLKLEPGKGPGEFLVIDHVERPSEN